MYKNIFVEESIPADEIKDFDEAVTVTADGWSIDTKEMSINQWYSFKLGGVTWVVKKVDENGTVQLGHIANSWERFVSKFKKMIK